MTDGINVNSVSQLDGIMFYMVIQRKIWQKLQQKLKPGKVVLLLGPRRVGKTFLLNQIIKSCNEDYVFWNGEDFAVHELLARRSIQNYKNLLSTKKILLIDEAQKIPDIGNILKLIVDSLPQLKIIATGSSAFDIANYAGEPLTGRKYNIFLFPFSEKEFFAIEEPQKRFDNLCHRMIYGNLPELISIDDNHEKMEYLKELLNSYLLKDILVYENIKNASKIFSLLQLLAFQVGSEVSLENIGRKLSMSKNTVERYLDLLSKVFIVHQVKGFSRNLRKEVTKQSKWYFYDNGIRNAIISNFSSLNARNDIGSLWENYMIAERLKTQSYEGILSNNYFWRTYDQQEIDWVEEVDGKLTGYEFKWKEQKVKIPGAWSKNYEADFEVIHNQNYHEFLKL